MVSRSTKDAKIDLENKERDQTKLRVNQGGRSGSTCQRGKGGRGQNQAKPDVIEKNKNEYSLFWQFSVL